MQTKYYIITNNTSGKQYLMSIRKKIKVFYYYNDDIFKNSYDNYFIDINQLSSIKVFFNLKEISKQDFNYLLKNEPENYCINR